MKVDLFDFDLPHERIALRPAEPRDSARMLLVDPQRREPFADHAVADLPRLLEPGDLLVLNNTKVIPARLDGHRVERGAANPQIEVTLHRRLDDSRWAAFARPGRKLAQGDVIRFGQSGNVCLYNDLYARVVAKHEAGEIELAFSLTGAVLDEAIRACGRMPLPPYIASKRREDDRDAADYQTIYAETEGAVAAPTAGLHFTDRLFEALEDRGVSRAFVTLHVGAGTFQPVKAAETGDHRMHAEWGEVPQDAADAIAAARGSGARVVAVGTTVARLLETAASDGEPRAWRGSTNLFITPGYRFRAVDVLLSNFHLPKSTLFMLVSAFSGLDTMKQAYAHAIEEGYRFYSYGDACLLFPQAR